MASDENRLAAARRVAERQARVARRSYISEAFEELFLAGRKLQKNFLTSDEERGKAAIEVARQLRDIARALDEGAQQ